MVWDFRRTCRKRRWLMAECFLLLDIRLRRHNNMSRLICEGWGRSRILSRLHQKALRVPLLLLTLTFAQTRRICQTCPYPRFGSLLLNCLINACADRLPGHKNIVHANGATPSYGNKVVSLWGTSQGLVSLPVP
jgi:hypothetical protein